jgi:hypothetical protein
VRADTNMVAMATVGTGLHRAKVTLITRQGVNAAAEWRPRGGGGEVYEVGKVEHDICRLPATRVYLQSFVTNRAPATKLT